MKAKVEHTIPLSARAIEIVNLMRGKHDGSSWLFPGAREGRPISNMAMLELLRGMGTRNSTGEAITVHGFRSTFRQWAAEQTNYPREAQQSHPDQAVVIAGDRNVRYEEVLKVLDLLQQSKVKRVGLLARPAS